LPETGTVWNAVSDSSFRLNAPGTEPEALISDAFGGGMGKHLYLNSAPMIGIQTPKRVRLAVTRLVSENPLIARTVPFPKEPYFTVQVFLRPITGAKLWYGNRQQAINPHRDDGGVTIHDFNREPAVYLGSSFEMLQFYVPREALWEFADQNDLARNETLEWPNGKVDPTFRNLALSILPAFQQPEAGFRIYMDYIILAVHAYIARTYGGISTPVTATRGGLALWQKQRAADILRAHLDGDISLQEVAQQCRLSPSRFAHAFRKTFGMAPHRWVVERRLQMAKDLMLYSDLPIVDVAVRSGFCDQAAFYRAFKRSTGCSPNQWRRDRKTVFFTRPA
jgi:AraC family transcriptional regulator